MARKQHDKEALRDPNRILQLSQSNQDQVASAVSWISNPLRDNNEVEKIANILENALGFKYFLNLRSKLNLHDYYYFLSHLSVEHRAPGSIVIDKGKKNDNFYVILQGQVLILDEVSQEMENLVLSNDKNPSESHEPAFQTINSLKPGQTFGEVSLINPKMLTTARVVVKCECILLVANQDTFYRTLNQSEHMKLSEKLHYFRNNILFEGVSENRLRELLSEIRQIRYGLNERVYELGNSHEEMYFIVEGEVEILNSKGRSLVLLGVREHFGVEQSINYNGLRFETAVSKSQQLIVYRIFFKRLSVLQQELPKFVKTLSINLRRKAQFYRQLEDNQRIIRQLLHHPHQKGYRRRRRKNIESKSKPNFEWWGVTDCLSNPKLQSVKRARYSNIWRRQDVAKEPLATNNKGATRMTNFVRTCKQKLNTTDVGYRWLEDKENQMTYLPANNLTCILGKKTLKSLEANSTADCPAPPRHALPKINKQRLLQYARSLDNFCQKLYLD